MADERGREFMPVGQVSGQLRPRDDLSLAAYYQYEWRKSRIPASGSYFSTTDILDAGGERLLLGPQPGPALFRGNDLTGSSHGQWGVSARYRSDALDTEFGVYYLRFHEKLPQVYLQPTARDYFLVYPEDITVIGVSASTGIGSANVAGEIHVRRDTPLASIPLTVPARVTADNKDNPLYAVGNTVHAQVSVIYPLSLTRFWQGGSVSAEVGGVVRTSITRNAASADPTRDREAWGLSLRFTPSYFQVLPNLNLDVPVSLSYNIKGKTPVTTTFNGDKAGVFSVGLNAEFQRVWNASLLYTVFFGGQTAQPLNDRDFFSLAIQRTF